MINMENLKQKIINLVEVIDDWKFAVCQNPLPEKAKNNHVSNVRFGG